MAIPSVLNVMIISLLFFLIFGIIGVNYFKGQFFYCGNAHLDDKVFGNLNVAIEDKWACINSGGEWK